MSVKITVNVITISTLLLFVKCYSNESEQKDKVEYYRGYDKNVRDHSIYQTLTVFDSCVIFNREKVSLDNEKYILPRTSWVDSIYDRYKIKGDTIFVDIENSFANDWILSTKVDFWVKTDYTYEVFLTDISSLSYIKHVPKENIDSYIKVNDLIDQYGINLQFINVGYPKLSLLDGDSMKTIKDEFMTGLDMHLFRDSIYFHLQGSRYVKLDYIINYLDNRPEQYCLLIDADNSIADSTISTMFLNQIKKIPIKTYRTCTNGKDKIICAYEM